MNDQDVLLEALRRIADSIADAKVRYNTEGVDAYGVCVTSLTEAVMGITAGLCDVAAAVREVKQSLDDIEVVLSTNGEPT